MPWLYRCMAEHRIPTMMEKEDEHSTGILERLLAILLQSMRLETLVEAWKTLQSLAQRRSNQSIYEILEYESTLELTDPQGERASFAKREKVRYLQDGTIAYQDQAWGDGDILLNYRCTPGTLLR